MTKSKYDSFDKNVMFNKISPRKISDEIIKQFKGLLGSGKFKPGDALPSERELAESIGVSLPPLREALSALQAMGLRKAGIMSLPFLDTRPPFPYTPPILNLPTFLLLS